MSGRFGTASASPVTAGRNPATGAAAGKGGAPVAAGAASGGRNPTAGATVGKGAWPVAAGASGRGRNPTAGPAAGKGASRGAVRTGHPRSYAAVAAAAARAPTALPPVAEMDVPPDIVEAAFDGWTPPDGAEELSPSTPAPFQPRPAPLGTLPPAPFPNDGREGGRRGGGGEECDGRGVDVRGTRGGAGQGDGQRETRGRGGGVWNRTGIVLRLAWYRYTACCSAHGFLYDGPMGPVREVVRKGWDDPTKFSILSSEEEDYPLGPAPSRAVTAAPPGGRTPRGAAVITRAAAAAAARVIDRTRSPGRDGAAGSGDE